MSKFDDKLASLDRAGLEKLLRQLSRKVRKTEAAIELYDAPAPEPEPTDEELNAALDRDKYPGFYKDGVYHDSDGDMASAFERNRDRYRPHISVQDFYELVVGSSRAKLVAELGVTLEQAGGLKHQAPYWKAEN